MRASALSDARVRILAAAQARSATRAERVWLHWTVQRYWRRTCHVLIRVLDDPADTHAVAEETFAHAWRALTAVRGPLAFELRLLQLTIEIAESRMSVRPRAASRSIHVAVGEGLACGSRSNGERWASSSRTLERSLSELPWVQRSAVVLRDVEGLATDVAAEVMRVELVVFRGNLHAGRMALVSTLDEHGDRSSQLERELFR
jgi:DNA-directed RNA polymerase specialized sigma24 family protein